MEGVGVARVRWRLAGAYRWRAFVALTAADAVIGHGLPPVGERQSLASAALTGLVINLLAVLFLSRPLGALLRRARPDLPGVVSRDYAATWVVIAVSGLLLGLGLAHRSSVESAQAAMHEATARAQAWIGDRAPPAFRRSVGRLSMYEIEASRVYRACATGTQGRTFCVVVDLQLPWAQSVRFAGSETNSSFEQGLG